MTQTQNYQQVEVFQHTLPQIGTGGLGTYTHYSTVFPLAPFANLEIFSASWEGIVGRQ